MVEKTNADKTLAEKKAAEKKTTTANENKNAVIQKGETDSSAAKKDEASVIKKTDVSMNVFPMTLEEFCTRLSQEKNQVEMIGGFYAHEKMINEKSVSKQSSAKKTSQHLLDTEVNFKTRFDDFCTLPVMS